MDLEIQGKTALVTGSTKGIGFAIAKALSKEGVTVYINGRNENNVRDAIAKIQKENPSGKVLPAVYDLSNKQGTQNIIQAIPDIDILVNNLGIYEVLPFEDITDEGWLHIFEVNVLSGIRLSRFYLPKMKKKNWGRIIFVSSESGVNIPKEMIHYGMTKTAQLSIARGLAETTAGTNVTVNSILPGPTYSEGVQDFIEDISKQQGTNIDKIEKEFFETIRPSSLLKRFASTDEVAGLAAFICSTNAAAINGASLRVEGGIVRSIV